MNWYISKLIFNILENNAESSSQFDEQLRMIQAVDKEEAFSIARVLGKNEENDPLVSSGGKNRVIWKFIDVVELNEIKELKNGMEIHSRVHEAEESKEYIKFAQYKAKTIQNMNSLESLIF
ncbi:MAG: DUF4288 domain-containing protein [Bacteroidota bacterium]|nr:DUF4288 domain-containing protein [Bacteroidota bacterium]